MVIGNVDVLLIPETKLDEPFPTGKFKIPRNTTFFRGGLKHWWNHDFCKKRYSSKVFIY